MRAIIKFLDDEHVNIVADSIEKENEWIIVRNDGKTVGLFDEGNIKCAYLSDKKAKKYTESDIGREKCNAKT